MSQSRDGGSNLRSGRTRRNHPRPPCTCLRRCYTITACFPGSCACNTADFPCKTCLVKEYGPPHGPPHFTGSNGC